MISLKIIFRKFQFYRKKNWIQFVVQKGVTRDSREMQKKKKKNEKPKIKIIYQISD
jgi:hypothetical protein